MWSSAGRPQQLRPLVQRHLAHPADKPVILKTLKTASIGIIVEGIRGIYDGATIDQERIFLKERKGFVKCAIQAGAGESR